MLASRYAISEEPHVAMVQIWGWMNIGFTPQSHFRLRTLELLNFLVPKDLSTFYLLRVKIEFRRPLQSIYDRPFHVQNRSIDDKTITILRRAQDETISCDKVKSMLGITRQYPCQSRYKLMNRLKHETSNLNPERTKQVKR